MQIYKQHFEPEINDVIKIDNIPCNSKILKIDIQDGKFTIWYMFNNEETITNTSMSIFTAFTGIKFKLPYNVKYMTTLQNGAFVFHFFVEKQFI